ncbi:hypothetical protein [Klebsiella oxytoca]|uniref:hypothetical protein n=1 Tax=Klebsiella oxytoca TaxID=571 RepID=UPI00254AA2A4|nr:hypothetical protein [Klebsiella oxytoca]MDK6514258.1 hypothetical protein [Klebsiella oxytoca]
MKNLQPGTALRNGERERILIRCREALAGYRGAALRYRFGAGIMMAVLQKHILSRFFVNKPAWLWAQNISCPLL